MKLSQVCLMSLLAALSATAPAAVTVPTQKGDNGRSELNSAETALTLQNVNVNTFGLLFKRSATGDMYPQPLIVSGLNIGGGSHNVVFLATAANNGYAYEPDDPVITAPYLSKNLGTPVSATSVGCCWSAIAIVIGIIRVSAIG